MLKPYITASIRYVSNQLWPALLWTTFVLVVCLMPSSGIPGSSVNLPGLDKIVHFILFTIWAFLWTGFRPGKIAYVILTGAMLGLGIEFVQELSEMGRSFEWWDFAADTAGVAAGSLVRAKLIPSVFPETRIE